jgi:class 3 adenylate cyclase
VTVLFMDIVRSTDLIQGRDPEEAMSILDAVPTRLGEAVHGHGGRVIKYMGDGFMAAFGLSNSRENEPEMAIRAGLAVVRRADEMAPELARTHGIAGLSVRVGMP